MSAANSRRKKVTPFKGKTWIWITIPLCLILLFGYLLFRNSQLPRENAETLVEKDAGKTGTSNIPALPETAPSDEAAPSHPKEYKLFFGNEDFNSSMADCDDVFTVFRDGEGVEDIISKALSELIKGPTEEEKEQGYYTSLNSGIRILGIRNEAGRVYADFSRELEEGVAGSCQTMAIRAQINETLLQFDGVREVVILVEGSPGDVLQP